MTNTLGCWGSTDDGRIVLETCPNVGSSGCLNRGPDGKVNCYCGYEDALKSKGEKDVSKKTGGKGNPKNGTN
ncbi:MAG: hypothetical protein OXR68_05860 [Alphaproteobacteria bacterium]|nr:hypothetical protein [Alphaproteobacteria bacterium]MDD9920129.1 hypothetical protein [Alphaproteobacteria bacterium]